MKPQLLLIVGFSCCLACETKKNESTTSDSTVVLSTDTVILDNNQTPGITPTANYEPTSTEGDYLMDEKGETVYVSPNQYSFISDPYDFSLDASTIENMLGEGAEKEVEEFEGGEDYGPYKYTTITYQTTSIGFYNFDGKHFSTIDTPLLPLKNGIKIGMKKEDFITAMGFDVNASQATLYRLVDDYGHMDFTFRMDTLSLIYAHYEEGD